MESDGPGIRAARSDEAEILSHICFRAKSYWEYPRELMNHWLESSTLSITPEEIEANPTYVAYDGEGELLGFYSLGLQDEESSIRNLCVLPELVGAGVRTMLFLHACEMAEESGASFLTVVSDLLESHFYKEMGAAPVGEKIDRTPAGDRLMTIFRMNL
ncbi:MAG: GNAT family N-acetyltransferase [Synergistaceae bacterium]|jgi:N-acetylglutamate synthase-like GNAT family acetyltransferase|nr:GNAT family N-acetyltransferase [Synergistaceae bacterium]